MMLFLITNIPSHMLDLRFTDREGAKSRLPTESSICLSLRPTRRAWFQFAKKFWNRNCWTQFREYVNVIIRTIYFERNTAEAANGATKIFVQTRTEGSRY